MEYAKPVRVDVPAVTPMGPINVTAASAPAASNTTLDLSSVNPVPLTVTPVPLRIPVMEPETVQQDS
jgi:hypothetical protein